MISLMMVPMVPGEERNDVGDPSKDRVLWSPPASNPREGTRAWWDLAQCDAWGNSLDPRGSDVGELPWRTVHGAAASSRCLPRWKIQVVRNVGSGVQRPDLLSRRLLGLLNCCCSTSTRGGVSLCGGRIEGEEEGCTTVYPRVGVRRRVRAREGSLWSI